MAQTQRLFKNEVAWVEQSATTPLFAKRQDFGTPAQLAGLRFERNVLSLLIARYELRFVPHQWWQYRYYGEVSTRWCQTDGILFDFERGKITIVEAKIRHTPDAWHQLFRTYLPILSVAFPGNLWDIACCEYVKHYDCDISCPQKPKIYGSISSVEPNEFGVVIWPSL